MSYDYLILATGVTTAFYGVKGATEHTFGLYTRTDAIALRDHLMAGFERLSVDQGDLNVTVVGGGATGVELAGTLAELRRTVLASTFPDVDPARVHVRLVEMAPHLLGPFHPKLQEYAKAQLLDRGVDVRLDTRIDEVTANQVRLAHGEDLPSRRRHRGEPGRSHAAARPARPADGAARRRADRQAGGPAGHRAVPVPRQGHHGHDRAPVGRGPAGRRAAATRHARLARLARPAPVLPARRAQPGDHADQPGVPVHLLGPRRDGDRRRRARQRPAAPGRQQELIPTDCSSPLGRTGMARSRLFSR